MDKKKPKYGDLKISIEATNASILDKSIALFLDCAITLGLSVKGPVCLPTKQGSLHIRRDAADYKQTTNIDDVRLQKRFLIIRNASNEDLEALSRLNIPSTAAISIVQS